MTPCGLVFPVWRQIGWVLWAGTGQREKLFCIDSMRCVAVAEEAPVVRDGFSFRYCTTHGIEMAPPEPKNDK